MAIDKIIPRSLVADEDELLLQEGDMTHALNVTVSQRGAGSENVIKNVKGTTRIQPVDQLNEIPFVLDAQSLPANDYKVIGSVSDPQRGRVYFFVCDNSFITEHHAIYMYNGSTYETVLRSPYLNFQYNGFVKADIINRNFQQDDNLQSVLFFTDNVNPPRKLNVDRALAGYYNGMSDDELDFAISSIRGASTKPPTFKFETDSSITDNNFEQNPLQFATQIIYIDGEESAISSYSKIAVSSASLYGGLQDAGYGVSKYVDNVCVIDHMIDIYHPDMEKVRILARKGNDGPFFVVDEFDPKQTLSRFVYGVNYTVYDPLTRKYRFYNNRLGYTIDDSTVNKLYDNVPLLAEGQTIAGNRLMYSNYTEGRPNQKLPGVQVTPLYSSVGGGVQDYISETDISLIFSETSPNYTATLTNAADIGPTTTLSAGTLIDIEFTFTPNFTVEGNIFSFDIVGQEETQGGTNYVYGSLYVDSVDLSVSDSVSFSVSSIMTQDGYATVLADAVQTVIDEVEIVTTSYISESFTSSSNFPSGTITGNLKVQWRFGEVTDATGAVVEFKPRIVKMWFVDDGDFNIEGTGGVDLIFPDDDSHTSDIYSGAGNLQNEVSFTNLGTVYSNPDISISTSGATPSFKAGASHQFGIVFYDKWGRSGFVNDLGSVYAKLQPERPNSPGDYGKVAMQFSFPTNLAHPSWADSYQIVYGGSSVSDVTQYTVGGAYVKRKVDALNNIHVIDSTTKNIYVSLRTLDIYQSDKEVVRNYSFTKGDKLRIISHRNADDTATVYPLSSTSELMEFEVVDVVVNPEEYIHIAANAPHEGANPTQDPHIGTFLVLSAPAVDSTVNSASINKYVGFDWYSISGQNYNESTQSTLSNYWNRQVVVEIITPRKTTEQTIYYEIGERRRLGVYKQLGVGKYGPPLKVNSGDVWFRPVQCKTPIHADSWIAISASDDEVPENWAYKTLYLESKNISDTFASEFWDKGRPHSKFDNAATVRRYNSITYGDAYEEDVSNFSLCSFNPTLANFFSLESSYGAIRYISKFNEALLALQENKLSQITVNSNIIEYQGSGAANVGLSTDVLGSARYSTGDYGCGNNPEAVLVTDNQVFFVDASRNAVLRLSGGQLFPISSKSVQSIFDSIFENNPSRIVSGYDPDDDVYYFTVEKLKTLGYNVEVGKWQSEYSFTPSNYSMIDNTMISCNQEEVYYADPQLPERNEVFLFHTHDSNTMNTFYGTGYTSEVQVVSKLNPSKVKVFNALSYEGNSGSWVSPSITTNNGHQSSVGSFKPIEGAYYAAIPRSTANSTGNAYGIGKCISVDAENGYMTIEGNAGRMGIQVGSVVYFMLIGTPTLVSDSIGNSTVSAINYPDTIKVPGALNVDVSGSQLLVVSNASVDGDALRGAWAKILMRTNQTSPLELYCINTHLVESKNNHSLGE